MDVPTIHLFSPVFFERWDYRNSVEKGIGGSETAATELAWRLARRGYEVASYAPLPRDCKRSWRGTTWHRLEEADFSQPGLWIVFRNAECIDKIPASPDHRIWLLCQDEAPIAITPERAAKCERVIALCEWHQRHLERHWPEVRGKVCVGSNGIKLDLIREVEKNPPVRNSKRLMYASSPDRGLIPLLKIFKRLREFVPEAELHCFYGLDNIRKLIKYNPRFEHYREFADELLRDLKQPGVFWHGRVSQKELYREWMKSGIWCYPTNFGETSCITCMEAAAMGAIPVCSPRAALAENVKHGVFVEGDANDPLVQARFVGELVRQCWHPVMQEDLRRAMMPIARVRFGWERMVDTIEAWLYEWSNRLFACQFAFQLRHATGRVLNVGCADDPARLGERGTNLDALETVPWTNNPTKAHVLHDARKPLPAVLGKFDSVVCGDILEHMTDADAVKVLKNAKAVLRPKGQVIVTCPEDYRPPDQQHRGKDLKYLPGESAYHERPITRALLGKWLGKAGLRPVRWQVIDYGHFEGWGVVAR